MVGNTPLTRLLAATAATVMLALVPTSTATSIDAGLLGPCDDGGAYNLALCTVDTSENAACVIVYGGSTSPTCIRNIVAALVDVSASSQVALLGPCDDGGAYNLALCTVRTSENAACVIIYGGSADPQCITKSIATAELPAWQASAGVALLGPCDDGGAYNLALCVVDTSESAACTIIYGGSADPDCVTRHLAKLVNPISTTSAAVGFLGPCDDGGALNLVYCTRDTTENAVCVIVYGGSADPDCLAIVIYITPDLTTSAGVVGFLGPCDDGGALNLVYCTRDTSENAVCVIVYGGSADPKCIRNLVTIQKPGIPIPYGFEAANAGLVAIGPCDDGGALNLAKCSVRTIDEAVCIIVYGGGAGACIHEMCGRMLDNCPLTIGEKILILGDSTA